MTKGEKRKSDYYLRSRDNKKKRIIESSDDEWSEGDEGEEVTVDLFDILNGLINNPRNPGQEKLDDNQKYLSTLTEEQKKVLRETEERINKLNYSTVPLKYKVLESNLEDKSKALLMQKVTFFEKLEPHNSEYFKLKKYMDGILNIPFKKYKGLEISNIMQEEGNFPDKIIKIRNFINDLQTKLNQCTFGQFEAKNTIIEIVGKWITNPMAKGNIIGLCGPPGCGKTSMIKNGLSKALKLPFAFIPLGGSMSAMTLEGSSYTYEGARWGRLVDILMENKCMNPVLFFDELDKLPQDKFGEEIASLLIHLTDSSQNNAFHDKYFSGIDFDLSKCFIIFSFNDASKINPILRDRINIVNLKGFELKEKIIIARDHCFENVCQNIGIDKDIVDIPDDTYKSIIIKYCPERGVRKVEQCLNTLLMKINLFHITRDYNIFDDKVKEVFVNISLPYVITPEIASSLLDPIYKKKEMDISLAMMYN